MWYVYVLYSVQSGKTYVGFSNDVDRRLFEHNQSETKGFTLRYRPRTVIYQERFDKKADAMKREKYLKTGKGREEIKRQVQYFLNNPGAVSAAAENLCVGGSIPSHITKRSDYEVKRIIAFFVINLFKTKSPEGIL